MGCDDLMITLEESSPHMHLKKKKRGKKKTKHDPIFKRPQRQILSRARFLNSMIREQLLFLIYDHKRPTIKFSLKNFDTICDEKAAANRDCDCI